MNPEGMAAWYYQGDGLRLWEETYAAFNLVPRPGPAVAPQMAGWFRKKIGTVADFKGLKMRIPNLGGKVYTKAGATTVLIPLAEVYAALERGVIDAAELVGPHDDMKMGLHRTARYYYYPGCHEPGTTLDFGFEVLPLPAPVLRDLKKLAAEAVREESEKSPMAKKVHASFTKFQALVGPCDHVAEGAYHQFVAG
jgi:TRAP-type mannitol/chloroaromatic compound transport system substrate-binding protein